MSNIVKYESNKFLALADNSEFREALEANMVEGESIDRNVLTKVIVPPGGETTWVVNSITGKEHLEEIVGILCYYACRGVLWPSEDVIGNQLPVLVTDDFVRAKLVGTIPNDMVETLEACKNPDGTYRWRDLPYTQFGSTRKPNSRGKRAKEQRVIAILREHEVFPILINVPPTSVRNISPFVKRLAQVPIPYFRAVIGLKLEKDRSQGGLEYGMIVPRLVGTIPSDAGAIVKTQYRDSLEKALATLDMTEFKEEEHAPDGGGGDDFNPADFNEEVDVPIEEEPPKKKNGKSKRS